MEYQSRIIAIRQETPTVKSFVLDLQGKEMDFHPGQWVDVFIDDGGETIIGGFTLTSSPRHKDWIQLTIKKGPAGRAAAYMHEQAKVGDILKVVGPSGQFYYEPELGNSLVLIAGGIGITPLISIIRYIDDANLDTAVTLLYSAETPEEFVYFDELNARSTRNSRLCCLFTVTGPTSDAWDGSIGRIDARMLAAAVKDRKAVFFVCGPTAMSEAVVNLLDEMGIAESQILAERW